MVVKAMRKLKVQVYAPLEHQHHSTRKPEPLQAGNA